MTGAIINHLWQSTVFAVMAGLLTLAFRKNRAQVRYWLWFSASVKFLLQFSLLLTLGAYLGRSRPITDSLAVPAITYTVVEVAEPFPVAPPPSSPATDLYRLDSDRTRQSVGLRTRGHGADAAAGVAAHPGGGAREQSAKYSLCGSGS